MSYVYLIECIRDYDTVYKIGYSKNPSSRIKNVNTGSDGDLKILYQFETKWGKKLEMTIHNLYSHKLINKEWYNLDINDVCNFIPLCEKCENGLNIVN